MEENIYHLENHIFSTLICFFHLFIPLAYTTLLNADWKDLWKIPIWQKWQKNELSVLLTPQKSLSWRFIIIVHSFLLYLFVFSTEEGTYFPAHSRQVLCHWSMFTVHSCVSWLPIYKLWWMGRSLRHHNSQTLIFSYWFFVGVQCKTLIILHRL